MHAASEAYDTGGGEAAMTDETRMGCRKRYHGAELIQVLVTPQSQRSSL